MNVATVIKFVIVELGLKWIGSGCGKQWRVLWNSQTERR